MIWTRKIPPSNLWFRNHKFEGGTVADKKIAVHYLEHNQLTLVGINNEKNAEWHAKLINSLKEKKAKR